MIKRIIFFVSLEVSFITYSSFGIINDQHDFILIKSQSLKNSYISYVQSQNGKIFIVKQKRHRSVHSRLCIVRDTLSAYIAEKVRIPTNRVCIIPPRVYFLGKKFMDEPASLHTYAPGFTLREQPSVYDDLYVQQRWKSRWSYEQKGLTVEVIRNMARHPALPLIVALDTFIGNSDRHDGNLCYDPKTDRFCGIDMDDTFNKNLCKVARDHVRAMLDDVNLIFSFQEVAGLRQYMLTLEKLIDKFTPDKLQKKLDYFVKRVGLTSSRMFNNKSVKHKLSEYKIIMVESYEDAKKLIRLLDKLIVLHT